MNEKRFNPSIFDSKHEVWDLLEQQAIIIEDLEKENEQLRQALKDIEEEKEQLKSKASSWKITCSQEMNEKADLMKQLVSLKEENEQLQNENKRLKSQQKWTKETLQKKLIVEIKPDFYGWRANVKELDDE